MQTAPALPPAPSQEDAGAVAAVRELMATAGYDEAHLYPLLGNPGIPAPGTVEYSHVLHRTTGPSALELLVRLFVLNHAVTDTDLDLVLRPGSREPLERAGLIRRSGDLWAPTAAMLPYDGLLIAFDSPHRIALGEAPAGLVMAVAGSSLAVARSALRAPRRRTLDLGTGNGYLALLASRWSRQVVATDVSPRSIEFARFNAALNRVTNVEFRTGDRFAPVSGERFDQIVCNPPFAITPDSRYLYRDGGFELDGFCRDLARTAPEYLEDDGVFQMVADWPQIEGEETDSRLEAWFESSPCDVFVLKDESRKALAYAEEWVVETESASAEAVERLIGEWMDYYASHRVAAISTGYILMRRRSAPPPHWFHNEDAPILKSGEFGEQVWRGVRAQDFLRTVPSDDALLRATVRTAPNLLLRQEAEWHTGGWHVTATRLRLATGLEREAVIDQPVMGLVARCDGSRPLVEIAMEMARALKVAPERLIPGSLAIVRMLIAGGFLVPQVPPSTVN